MKAKRENFLEKKDVVNCWSFLFCSSLLIVIHVTLNSKPYKLFDFSGIKFDCWIVIFFMSPFRVIWIRKLKEVKRKSWEFCFIAPTWHQTLYSSIIKWNFDFSFINCEKNVVKRDEWFCGIGKLTEWFLANTNLTPVSCGILFVRKSINVREIFLNFVVFEIFSWEKFGGLNRTGKWVSETRECKNKGTCWYSTYFSREFEKKIRNEKNIEQLRLIF